MRDLRHFSVKHQETVKNTRKQCETEWNSHKQRHFWFPAVVTNTWHLFTPPFITFSTRIFTPVGKSLHEHWSHRSHLFASLSTVSTFLQEFPEHIYRVLQGSPCQGQSRCAGWCPSEIFYCHNEVHLSMFGWTLHSTNLARKYKTFVQVKSQLESLNKNDECQHCKPCYLEFKMTLYEC